MVVKRISRRRKKSSSPRRKSRRKSKQKKRSRVRRRSKNKLEGGASLLDKIRNKQDTATGNLLSEYENSHPEAATQLTTHPEKMDAARKWKAEQKKEQKVAAATKRKDDLALLGDQFKQGVEDAKDSIKKQRAKDLNNLKKTRFAIRGKTRVLLVKKNEEEGSTCVYEPKDKEMTFEDLQNMLIRNGASQIVDIVSSTPVTNEDPGVFDTL
tara:strand:+ start:94 stop:726 length:633 start_codon:yes stop_codon:yes gene_type:complete